MRFLFLYDFCFQLHIRKVSRKRIETVPPASEDDAGRSTTRDSRWREDRDFRMARRHARAARTFPQSGISSEPSPVCIGIVTCDDTIYD